MAGVAGRAAAGEPALVVSPGGEAAFWLVPLVVGKAACGYARVELSGRVSQIGCFGQGGGDRGGWLLATFFQRVPAAMLREIRERYGRESLSSPVLSYDGTPAKWAWRMLVGDPPRAEVYVSPGGWYERAVGPRPAGFEG